MGVVQFFKNCIHAQNSSVFVLHPGMHLCFVSVELEDKLHCKILHLGPNLKYIFLVAILT